MMHLHASFFCLSLAFAACAGGDSATDAETTDVSSATLCIGDAACSVPCDLIARPIPNEGAQHVAEGTDLTPAHNPPASGPHYPVWARYQAYEAAVPRGYWIHSLEHGAIVFLYRPDADDTTIAALKSAYDGLADDPLCGHARSLMTPDSDLDTPFAIVAWDWVLDGSCVDAAVVHTFAERFRGQAPENICAHGSYDP